MFSSRVIFRSGAVLFLGSVAGAGLLAEDGPFPVFSESPPPNLLVNGSFTFDANGDHWPDGWSRGGHLAWKREEGRDFMRIGPGAANATVTLQRVIRIPSGVTQLDFTAVARAIEIEPGLESWHDARIVLQFKNANDAIVRGGPPAVVICRRGSTDWKAYERTFPVPHGAFYLECMVALFCTPAGSIDVDLLDLRPALTSPSTDAVHLNPEERSSGSDRVTANGS